ncbi:hypothetical protein BGAL_0001g00180 [Botrytis galanthina]|uniref:Uncharacterized protein n=1 Tax=Botrytis galanthina TaxID=278940 RepID=A0A4S8RCM4_9HELO|nr:hypothetical protein BGAL_0001g00180 [Botrytis galanthina]
MIILKFVIVEDTGHEQSLQVNYLSTTLLSILLLPILKAKGPFSGEPAHLTIVSAALALAARFPNKAANPLLASFDDSKASLPCLQAPGTHVSLEPYPTWCRGTGLGRDARRAMKIFTKLFGLLDKTPKVGASYFVDVVVNKGEESHGCFLMSWQIHPFAALLYAPEGKELTQCGWEETLAELQFAGAHGILESMKR